MWHNIRPNHLSAFLFSHGSGLQRPRATQFRRKPGFRTLRYGPGVVATPTALDASKEDAGKGGASPAPLPKVLSLNRRNALLKISAGISASNNRGRAWAGNFFAERERIAAGRL
jgi:hypothetical protein